MFAGQRTTYADFRIFSSPHTENNRPPAEICLKRLGSLATREIISQADELCRQADNKRFEVLLENGQMKK